MEEMRRRLLRVLEPVAPAAPGPAHPPGRAPAVPAPPAAAGLAHPPGLDTAPPAPSLPAAPAASAAPARDPWDSWIQGPAPGLRGAPIEDIMQRIDRLEWRDSVNGEDMIKAAEEMTKLKQLVKQDVAEAILTSQRYSAEAQIAMAKMRQHFESELQHGREAEQTMRQKFESQLRQVREAEQNFEAELQELREFYSHARLASQELQQTQATMAQKLETMTRRLRSQGLSLSSSSERSGEQRGGSVEVDHAVSSAGSVEVAREEVAVGQDCVLVTGGVCIGPV